MKSRSLFLAIALAALSAALWLIADRALAHCDTMDGPFVPEARRALDRGDVTPLLKWVRAEDEAAIHDAFDRTRAVRGTSTEVREIADQLFLETLIRIHRAGEGEPFTGLRPAGSAPPIFRAADDELEAGSVDALADELSHAVRQEIAARFSAAMERRAHASESVEAGRAYVQAYVRLMHFVESVHGFVEHGAADGHFDSGLQTGAAHDEERHGHVR